MSDAFDEFFDDEQELMSAEGVPGAAAFAGEAPDGESVPFKGENATPKKAGKDEHAAAQEAATDEGVATQDRKSTRLNSSHITRSRMPSSA